MKSKSLAKKINEILNFYYANGNPRPEHKILSLDSQLPRALLPGIVPNADHLQKICYRLIVLCTYMNAVESMLTGARISYPDINPQRYHLVCSFGHFYDTFLLALKRGRLTGNPNKPKVYYLYVALFMNFLKKLDIIFIQNFISVQIQRHNPQKDISPTTFADMILDYVSSQSRSNINLKKLNQEKTVLQSEVHRMHTEIAKLDIKLDIIQD